MEASVSCTWLSIGRRRSCSQSKLFRRRKSRTTLPSSTKSTSSRLWYTNCYRFYYALKFSSKFNLCVLLGPSEHYQAERNLGVEWRLLPRPWVLLGRWAFPLHPRKEAFEWERGVGNYETTTICPCLPTQFEYFAQVISQTSTHIAYIAIGTSNQKTSC